MSRIHWPQAVLLIATLVCMAAAPVAFFALVPERIIDKLFDLPWTTILTVGTPLIVGAITALRSAFTGPLLKTKEEAERDSSPESTPDPPQKP
jgi:hypothetical protein